MGLSLRIHFSLLVNWDHAHLSHVLKRAEISRFETQLAVLDAETLILSHRLDLLGEELELVAWVGADCTRQIDSRCTTVNQVLNRLQLLLIFDD